jgi:flagellar basal-body rod protein FlgG
MYDALYIGATGMRAHQTQVDTIANNVANMSTVGYRRHLVSFSQISAAAALVNGEPVLDALQVQPQVRGAGTLAHVGLSGASGDLKQTGEMLDVAIDGNGFIEVVRADAVPAYTRAGSLKVDSEGLLALADGMPLAVRIQVPPDATDVRIDKDGRVFASLPGESEDLELGRIELVSFANPAGLQAAGGNLFLATNDSGEARVGMPTEEGLGAIRQGYLEGSNVQLIEELVAMMVAQRAFEMNGRVVQAADQMMAITNGLYRS